MRRIFMFLLSFGCLTMATGQVIENRLSLQLGVLHGTFSGDSVANENGFITPSLFPQLKGTSGISAAASYKLLPVLSLGLGAEVQYAYGWALQTADDFDGANVIASSVYPFIKIHTPLRQQVCSTSLSLRAGLAISPASFTSKWNITILKLSVPGLNTAFLNQIGEYAKAEASAN